MILIAKHFFVARATIVEFTYDAWGNILTQYGSLADINPFRYRGYYYDNESWFYYLQSRYYDPSIGRFINADAFASTGQGLLGYNMFSYCLNNPIIMDDPSGHFPWLAVVGCAAVVIAVVGCCAVVDTVDKSGANEAEKDLIYQDPIAAYNVNEAKKITEEYIDKYYGLDRDFDGTQVNAFRHAMWNAVMTDKIGIEKAKKFADAHEQVPNNPTEHLLMDLHNNELGRNIAIQYAGQGYSVFAEKIIEAINNGEAEVLIWDTIAG